jgi:hypothetical protein
MEIKDKPSTMSVREWITKKVALASTIPENVIRRVVAHQFDSAYDALEKFNSIEISGFGKFYYNTTKADKELIHCKEQADSWQKRLESEGATEKERQQAREQVKWFNDKVEWMTNKKKNGTV